MKAMALQTHTLDCIKTWDSFRCLGHEVIPEVYDNRPHDRHGELVERAKEIKPDFIIYIGAIERYHLRPVPEPDTLKALRAVAPMVHICGDGSDWPWWKWLELYHDEQCFDVQVNIDGNTNCPLANYDDGMILLTPTNPSIFENRPWQTRGVNCGLAGGIGHSQRTQLINYVMSRGLLTLFDSALGRSYEEMGRFVSDCRMTFNIPMNGTGDKDHVKGRVIEAALAGSCVVERKKSPTRYWFNRGIEYREYYDGPDAARQILLGMSRPDETARIAERLHQRVMAEHHPRIFWEKVLTKMGLKYESDGERIRSGEAA